jgi:streptogramin lyase
MRSLTVAATASLSLAAGLASVVPPAEASANAGGVVTNYTGTGVDNPAAITTGPNGTRWFVNYGNNSIGRITTAPVRRAAAEFKPLRVGPAVG